MFVDLSHTCRAARAARAALVLTLALVACDDKKDAPAETATASATAPAPTPSPTPPPPPPAPAGPSRPEKIDLAVTPAQRTKVETAVPEAKGFLVAKDIEEKIKPLKLKEKEGGVTAFDRLAKGKWVLFEGPIANLTESGFDLGITYTPQIKGDMMGMSRQWFPVTFSDVKGYQQTAFKGGQMVIVLAKYLGKQKATPGSELVATGNW
jgi:hypothetical protein